MLEKYLKNLENKGEIYLRIKVRPGATRSEIREVRDDDTLKIDIKAPAENNRANEELIRFLSQEFSTTKDQIRILSGAGERTKLVKIIK